MKALQKKQIAQFLDKFSDYLSGSHEPLLRYEFSDDRMPSWKSGAPARTEKPALCGKLMVGTGGDECTGEGAPAKPTATDALKIIAGEIAACGNCALHAQRIKPVPGEGVPHPLVMIVGEAPGADEDRSGRPFVGAAGQLLDKMLNAIGLSRGKNCFITNVVKCRPPQNRDPNEVESRACFTFLQRQLQILKPMLILTLGNVPSRILLEKESGITKLRGTWHEFNGIPVMPTFHPSYLLRDESQKAPAWEDLKTLCARLADMDGVYNAETADLRRKRNI
ncbi:uracil-DNA glycosylase [Spirochaetia bacterium]|nr:uracil-DNA glycosylase [Spirochaetia bacterium]